MKHFYTLGAIASMLLFPVSSVASVSLQDCRGWFESGYVTWSGLSGATDYHVYYKSATASDWLRLDAELVRQYPTYYRADVLGISAGDYQFRVVPVSAEGEMIDEATESATFTATAHDRSGFAHVGMAEGMGAYKNDGTLKDGAKVLYVWADNAKTISSDVITSTKGATTTGVGLQDIINLYQKGVDKTPLAVRIVGTIRHADMDNLLSAEGLQVKGKSNYSDMPITIEGVGNDATIHGFGILLRACRGTEIRNFAVMNCLDDCLSLDTGNSNIWIHNMDFFYGKTGSDSDQAKGDGTVDMKGKTMNVTVSYNHFYDAGKSSLGGMKSETTDCWHTFHHNWFDHSDSRHPRVRTMFYHVYNNYFDGIAKYGVGVTMGGTALVENNYFRNCKYPMLSSRQGTDAEGDGTFSGETGGVVKAFNNVILHPRKVQYYDGSQTDGKWDAVLVTDRAEAVTATAFTGGTGYNAEADLAARTSYLENKIDAPEDVPSIVRGWLGAGRMGHGDFAWTFRNSVQDENYGVIAELKAAITDYTSMLVGFANGTPISNGGALAPVDGGDGKGLAQEVNDAYVPSWYSGGSSGGEQGGETTDLDLEAFLGSDADYFWFNAENEAAVQALIAEGIITGGNFQPNFSVSGSDGTSYSNYTGSIRLASAAALTFYHEEGIARLDLYTSGNGSMSWQYSVSEDGLSFTNLGGAVTAAKGAHPTLIATPASPVKYIRVTNGGSGNRDVQGVRMYTPVADTPTAIDSLLREEADPSREAGAIYDLRGRRVESMQKPGLYIVGGRTVMIR